MPLVRCFDHLKRRRDALREEFAELLETTTVCDARVKRASNKLRRIERLKKTLEPDSEFNMGTLDGSGAPGPGHRVLLRYLQYHTAAKDNLIVALRRSVTANLSCKRKRDELEDAHFQYNAAVNAVYNAICGSR